MNKLWEVLYKYENKAKTKGECRSKTIRANTKGEAKEKFLEDPPKGCEEITKIIKIY